MTRTRRKFTDEQKKAAVEDYVSGRKSASQVAGELNVAQGVIYKWRVELDEKAKGVRVEEMESRGISTDAAKKILQLEAEINEYQKKVAQQSIIIDLLKKLQKPKNSQPESELTGLIDITKKSDRAKRHVK